MYTECRHIMPRGTKCKSPALRGQSFCYFHQNLRCHSQDGARAGKGPLQLPSIEDTHGVQTALGQVLGALASERLEARHAGLLLYGLQIAAQLAVKAPQTNPEEIVQAVSSDESGVMLGPETVSETKKESKKHVQDWLTQLENEPEWVDPEQDAPRMTPKTSPS